MNIHKRNKRHQAALVAMVAPRGIRAVYVKRFKALIRLQNQQLLEIARVKFMPADIMDSFPGGLFGGRLTFSMSTPADRLGLIFPALGAKE